jgi:hypothetical protein
LGKNILQKAYIYFRIFLDNYKKYKRVKNEIIELMDTGNSQSQAQHSSSKQSGHKAVTGKDFEIRYFLNKNSSFV